MISINHMLNRIAIAHSVVMCEIELELLNYM